MHRVTRSFTHALVLTAWIAAAFLPTSGARGDSGTPGVWSIVDSPNTSATESNSLLSVACVSESDCWAVGAHANPAQTLAEHWDGRGWSIVASPNAATASWSNYLRGVTCVSDSDCWAVGATTFGGVAQNLVEHWNGVSWVIVDYPTYSGTDSLWGVACTSPSDCWAVGSTGIRATTPTISPSLPVLTRPLLQHWDGASWAVAASDASTPLAAVGSQLEGITCTSLSDCWAVGWVEGYSGRIRHTLVEHWDGDSWSIVTSPNFTPTGVSVLTKVACSSASRCWAVGYHDEGLPAGSPVMNQILIERWDGSAWTIAFSPDNPEKVESLTGVACALDAAGGDCWAVGRSHDTDGIDHTLIAAASGDSWSLIASPNTSASAVNQISGLACLAGSRCWAVGSSRLGADAGQTLTLHTPLLPPVAALSATPASAPAGGIVSFSGAESLAVQSGTTIASYTFDFGDGTALVTQAGATVDHAYANPGNYTATLTVTDSLGSASANLAQVGIEVTAKLGLEFYTVTPCRVLDTRQAGGALASGVGRSLLIGGACGIPATAKAVSFNLTATSPTGAGSVAFYPDSGAPPIAGATGTINFASGQTRANNQVLGLVSGGAGTLQAQSNLPGGGSVHVVVDVNGYFE